MKLKTWKRGDIGYDVKSRRYRDPDGKVISKTAYSAAVRGGLTDNEYYGETMARSAIRTPFSDVSIKAENIIRGAQNLEALLTYQDPETQPSDRDGNPVPRPNPIPQQIVNAYRLVDWYLASEGDVFQHISAPIDIALGSEIEINHPDPGVTRELRAIYGPGGLDMWSVFNQIWLSVGTYGVAYPLEVPSSKGGAIEQITMLPPRFMWTGYYVPTGVPAGDGNYKLYPFVTDQSVTWSEELVSLTFQPMTYNAFAPNWNEQVARGWDLPISGQHLYPVRDKSMSYTRYPTPALSRAFRQMSTRIVFEEMMRATIEGYRNQLVMFLLDDSKDGKRPTPQEMKKLRETVDGMSGGRTGDLVWRGNLRVEIITPKSIEQMLATEAWTNFTLQIFRQLGTSIRLATGNTAAPGRAEGNTLEVDMKVWLRRLDFMRTMLVNWESQFRVRLAKSMKDSALAKTVDQAQVRFSRSLIETADLIQSELRPLYAAGLLDPQSALERAGYSYSTVLRRKEEGQATSALFNPPSSFAQTVVRPGQEQRKVESPVSPGRPVGKPDVNAMIASFKDNKERDEYMKWVLTAMDEMFASGDISGFVSKLGRLNNQWLGDITEASFKTVTRLGDLDKDVRGYAANYVNSYLDNLEADLVAAREAGKDLRTFAWRIGLYPSEGYKAAFFNGQRAGMDLRGARGWRRVLQESESGPCPLCRADAKVVHAISEPFQVLHPNEACAMQELHISYTTDKDSPTIEVPVPSAMSEWESLIEGLLPGSEHFARRRRA